MDFQDKVLTCRDCGKEFMFSAGEQAFYAEKGFQNQPTRCKNCRAAKKGGPGGGSVGMDSGPMHVAALLGTPTVGVFGRSDPEIHGPAGHLAARVVAGPDAREWKTRARKDLPPFHDPEPRAVVDAALELLAERRRASAPMAPSARTGSDA